MEVQRVVVIGGGLMGRGLVEHLIANDAVHDLVWIVREDSQKTKLLESVCESFEKLIQKGRLPEGARNSISDKLNFGDYPSIRGADLVIEAVSESYSSKSEVIAEANKFAHGGMIFATNTSSLSIEKLSCQYKYPSQFIGLHFFNPVGVMKLVEVVVSQVTADSAKQGAESFVGALNKNAVLVKDSPGFVVNRLLIPYINEAVNLLAEGVATCKDIDSAMKMGANHPIGPLALADLIGIDVIVSILEVLRDELASAKYTPSKMLYKMIEDGRIGRKVSRGFYEYQ